MDFDPRRVYDRGHAPNIDCPAMKCTLGSNDPQLDAEIFSPSQAREKHRARASPGLPLSTYQTRATKTRIPDNVLSL